MSRRCMFVHDWTCIVPSHIWTDLLYPDQMMYCSECREIRTVAAELRQKKHILDIQIEAYDQGVDARKMNQQMHKWSLEERYDKAERTHLEATEGG